MGWIGKMLGIKTPEQIEEEIAGKVLKLGENREAIDTQIAKLRKKLLVQLEQCWSGEISQKGVNAGSAQGMGLLNKNMAKSRQALDYFIKNPNSAPMRFDAFVGAKKIFPAIVEKAQENFNKIAALAKVAAHLKKEELDDAKKLYEDLLREGRAA